MTEREAPARLEDQPDTLAMIEKVFGGARDILMNDTTNRYLSDHIEELIAARVAVARQASRKQALEESHLVLRQLLNATAEVVGAKTAGQEQVAIAGLLPARERALRYLTTPSKGQP